MKKATGGHITRSCLPIVLGVTGHRDIQEVDIPNLSNAVRQVLNEIGDHYKHSPVVILSSLAEGADRLAAHVGLGWGAELVVALPMSLNEYRKDFQRRGSLEEFDSLLSRAAQVVEVQPDGNIANAYVGDARKRCYALGGSYVVIHSQILLALWDGEPSDELGGTSQVVSYKLNDIPAGLNMKRRPLDQIERGPVYHIITPRIGNPKTARSPFSIQKLYPGAWEDQEAARSVYNQVLARIDEFNWDEGKYAERLQLQRAMSKAYVLSESQRGILGEVNEWFLERYAVADTLSIYFQKRRYRALAGMYILIVIAFAFFNFHEYFVESLTTANTWKPITILLYPLLLFAAYLLSRFVHIRQYQDKHLEYRALAEGLRVQMFWNLSGVDEKVADYYLAKHEEEVLWIRHALRMWSLVAAGKKATSPEGRGWLQLTLKQWVDDQRKFFHGAFARNSERIQMSDLGVTLSFGTSMVLALTVSIFHERFELHGLLPIAGFSISLFLSFAASMGGYADRMVFSEQAKQYLRLWKIFSRGSSCIQEELRNGELETAKRLLVELGMESLDESGDWLHLHRSRPINLPKG